MANGISNFGQWMNNLSVQALSPYPGVSSVGDFVFYRQIMSYLTNRISDFEADLLGRFTLWVSGVAMIVLTIWVMIQGFNMITGRSRESMAAFIVTMCKSALIVTIAASIGMSSPFIQKFVNDDVKKEIAYAITGENKTPEDQVDESLGWMQVALSSIDVLDVVQDPTLDSQKSRAMWMVGVGTGGPAVVAGSMMLLYRIAMALFVGFGPLFILCLLFEQTKSLFQRWLFYGIGTFFSMSVLAVMTSIALDMVTKVSMAFWGSSLLGSVLGQDFTSGISSQALQQGGMGLILTTLILTAPPMAAMFFQGTLGAFTPYAAMGAATGAASRPGPQGQPPGSYAPQTYSPPQIARDANSDVVVGTASPTRVTRGSADAPQQSEGKFANAPLPERPGGRNA
ncbi:type IV secretion system protein [Xanthomonas campestris pv. raphani]|nr:type IV secretion system protein [Xanthomonas campestris]MCW2036420.1 type IV secretion system protein VirB6 [Xanthomonas campestris]MEA0735043.1 type IV secretion system protein [Xanthomonas campestris pv. campestris]MEA9787841.1 type IV secretion system protein [Xanthomonas campestris pv. raphani]MEA9827258.1 type IV secretion system protein [Xanthomonas campestris pv. raphani]